MASSTPRDKYSAVWLIFFMLGLGTLLPWNFFMTATMYFTSRLKDSSVSEVGVNRTEEGDRRSHLESKFNNVMTLCAMLPLLLFTCLNSFLHSLIPQKLRVMGSLTIIMAVFMATAVLVKVEMEPLPFFTVTMIKIVIINSFGAVLQGSLFGMAAVLPTSYTTPIMSGQGLAGTFAALAMICAIASGSEIQEAAFGYFITACVVILLSILSYVVLPKMEFYQYYRDIDKRRDNEEENPLNAMKKETRGEARPDPTSQPSISMMKIFKKIWVLAVSVCFTFTVTIGTFPAITADVKTTIGHGGAWELYFIPVSCFLLFNLCDWAGRSLTAVCMWPGKDSCVLPVSILARLLFVPLFMLCNVQPRSSLPVYFQHDAWFILFMLLFASSNGYLASLCMCYGPKKVLKHEAETAGAIMAFFLSLGLALGAALSFLFRGLV
ncbi:equilibrative nucleoside transporter 1-like [Lampris incognitus]|uniref:equilibrative nucleoside transporter 1-like n=1 Tax=Lampris incognitus TaxID=2546036 RepID=UPI0024B5A629|nr:equilibrative nucleoside transporter 1-like [Lampris incognitus]